MELSEDLPGHGQYYCLPCGSSVLHPSDVTGVSRRYFVNASSLLKHEASKLHKKRLKLLSHHPKLDLGRDDDGSKSVRTHM